MRDHSKHICLESKQAVQTMLDRALFNPRTEQVRTEDALGRVTASDVRCPLDLPNALCSRMDAIAVYYDDFAKGMPDVSQWELGRDYNFANTGTAIEGDFDTCILIERCQFDENEKLTAVTVVPAERGDKTIAPGSRHHKGELIVEKGTRLTATKLSALAMAGISEVPVVAKPRVAFLPTGDELVPLGFPLPHGRTYESNSIMIKAKLQQWGAECYVHPIIGDDWEQIKDCVLQMCEEFDIVILNAGSSKGSKDFNLEILEESGEVICHEVNHGPGHHSSYSLVSGTPIVGISGPPSGAEYTADWYLKPLIDLFLFGKPIEPVRLMATLAHDLPVRGHSSAPGMKFFGAKRARLTRKANGELLVSLIERGSMPELIGEDAADCFVRLYDEDDGKPAGSSIEVELRWPYTFPGARDLV